jgi:putative PIN family toxin of toxin-antitoxin system
LKDLPSQNANRESSSPSGDRSAIQVRSRVVLDTNVVVSGVYSDAGSSYQILMRLAEGVFRPCVSVPLLLEYEQTLLEHLQELEQTREEIFDILDYICTVSVRQTVFYLWRPFLKDPKDDMVLELAVASHAGFIVTHNKKHFGGVERFGIRAMAPSELLNRLRRRQ